MKEGNRMEKQIEKQAIDEMARVIERTEQIARDNVGAYPSPTMFAKDLYWHGYRKQSENTVELPCKIGDTVYIIDEADDECGEDYVLAVKVLQFFINEHGIAIELALPLGMRLNTWMVVGENVFLTEVEAEKALAKMKGGAE